MSFKVKCQQVTKIIFLISCLVSFAIIPLLSERVMSAFMAAFNPQADYLLSPTLSLILLIFYGLTTSGLLLYLYVFDHTKTLLTCLLTAVIIGFITLPLMFYADMLFMRYTTRYSDFSAKLLCYIDQEYGVYGCLLLYLGLLVSCLIWLCKKEQIVFSLKTIKTGSFMTMLIWGLIIGFPFPWLNYFHYADSPSNTFFLFETGQLLQNSLLTFSLASVFLVVWLLKKTQPIAREFLIGLTQLMLILSGVSLLMTLVIFLKVDKDFAAINQWDTQTLWLRFFDQCKTSFVAWLPLFVLGVSSKIIGLKLKGKLGGYTESGSTSNSFGGAKWATLTDLKEQNLFDSANGPLIGADKTGTPLFYRMSNKLTLSPPGGGKTTCSSIPVLLDHTGPVFVLDIKGELFATTAKHRLEVMGRKPIVIDPFGITKSESFRKELPEALLQNYTINPFDWLPAERDARDRILNAFAGSLVINEGGSMNHFDENAKILIRGYIDYLMTQPKEDRNLPKLFSLCTESVEDSEETLQKMIVAGGRAMSAANQICRVGSDERGSILSTTYRQIDWLGDSNIDQLLTVSNFDLSDFLKGNLDIYVVLPVDQVKEHGRLFRMIMCLLMSVIIQADPKDLPEKKILFLIEEIAQIGPSEDVEQCIEVLRARGVNIWVVFQTLAQIKKFKKPDLFLTMALKQIFTTDDPDTMEWVQKLGGDRTILTKTLSTNSGDSRQRMQTFGGSVSSGAGESVHEAGVKLIALNEISVMPKDEQFIFIEGQNPIRCKKIRYFDHALFKGKFGANPLENPQ